MKKTVFIIFLLFLMTSCGNKISFESLTIDKQEEIRIYVGEELNNIVKNGEVNYYLRKKINQLKKNKEINNFLKSRNIKFDDKNISGKDKKDLEELIKEHIAINLDKPENIIKNILIEKLEKKYSNINFDSFIKNNFN